jgi:hypothetical protein
VLQRKKHVQTAVVGGKSSRKNLSKRRSRKHLKIPRLSHLVEAATSETPFDVTDVHIVECQLFFLERKSN